MLWILGAIAAVVILFLVFFLVFASPMRRVIALNLACQSACKKKDFTAALRFCRESYEAAGRAPEVSNRS